MLRVFLVGIAGRGGEGTASGELSGEGHPAKMSGGTWLGDKAVGTPQLATSQGID